MIVVRCMGGLGNQMFQYAFGRSLAQRGRDRLRLDLSHYRGDELRRFDLDHFAVRYRKASLRDLGRFTHLGWRSAVLSAPWRLLDRGRCTVVRERFFHFDAALFDTKDCVYLDGYWQSPRYFDDIAGDVRRELSLRDALEQPEAALEAHIAAVESVAVHVRGGDYRSDPVTDRTLGTLPSEYYRAALAHLRERVRDPAFLVFSDDPAWARAVIGDEFYN